MRAGRAVWCACALALCSGCAALLNIEDIPLPEDAGQPSDAGDASSAVEATSTYPDAADASVERATEVDASSAEAAGEGRDARDAGAGRDASEDATPTRDAATEQPVRPTEASTDVAARDGRVTSDAPISGADAACDGCSVCPASTPCTPANPCHTGLTACAPTQSCVDTGTSIPDGIACGSTASCQGGRCTCGASSGNTPAFVGCASSTACQPGFVCVDNNGDGVFYCKPVCATDADCAAYLPSLPTLRCAEASCFGGEVPGVSACNDNPGRLHPAYDATSCCGGGDGGPVSDIGCSDGTREGFVDRAKFPTIAGCEAVWPESSMRSLKGGVACGNSLRSCAVPADACAVGWHVCAAPPYGPADVSSKITITDCLAQTGEFAMAVGDQQCDPCDVTGYGAACCGTICVQQNGSCVFPGQTAWFGVIDGHDNLCSDIIANHLSQGVMCCRGF